MKINGLILAAGNSSRLGQPKQLVKYQGMSLLADIENKLLNICDNVYVVLGYQAERFEHEISAAETIINSDWQAGMGSSLAQGVKKASQHCDGLLVALCDQPLIELEHYQNLAQTFNQNPEKIIATSYQQQKGVPVIFPQSYFQQLTATKADSGAQALITSNQQNVIKIVCQAASYDIDSVADLSKLDNSSVG